MKKFIITASIILVTSLFTFAQKIAFVDTQYILENVPEYNTAQDQLNQLSVDWQKEIEAKFTEIDKLYKSFQSESVLLPEEMKKKRQDEIVKKEKEAKELQKQRFGKDGDLSKKRQELVKPIQDKVYNAIEAIATEGGYAIIFDKTSSSVTMVYSSSKFDKSDDVLQKLGFKPGGYNTNTDKDKPKNK